jgi:hypothetical protein
VTLDEYWGSDSLAIISQASTCGGAARLLRADDGLTGSFPPRHVTSDLASTTSFAIMVEADVLRRISRNRH